jgi:hypothetical protein
MIDIFLDYSSVGQRIPKELEMLIVLEYILSNFNFAINHFHEITKLDIKKRVGYTLPDLVE